MVGSLFHCVSVSAHICLFIDLKSGYLSFCTNFFWLKKYKEELKGALSDCFCGHCPSAGIYYGVCLGVKRLLRLVYMLLYSYFRSIVCVCDRVIFSTGRSFYDA